MGVADEAIRLPVFFINLLEPARRRYAMDFVLSLSFKAFDGCRW